MCSHTMLPLVHKAVFLHPLGLDESLIYFYLALGTLSKGHLFLESTTCWVGLGIHTGATSCFTSNSQLSSLLCLVYYEWYYAHPTGVDLLMPALFRTRSLQKKPATITTCSSWTQVSSALNMSSLCSQLLLYFRMVHGTKYSLNIFNIFPMPTVRNSASCKFPPLGKLFCGILQIMKIDRTDLFRDKDLRALLHNQGFPIKVQCH